MMKSDRKPLSSVLRFPLLRKSKRRTTPFREPVAIEASRQSKVTIACYLCGVGEPALTI